MEKLQLEREKVAEHGSVSSEYQQMALSQASQENVVAKTKAPVQTKRIVWIATCFVLRDMPLLRAGDDLTGQLG